MFWMDATGNGTADVRVLLNTNNSNYGNYPVTFGTDTITLNGVDAGWNGSGKSYVAYTFAEKTGYSKFGTYIGNGATNNRTFLYLGFKPHFFLIKRLDTTEEWIMTDSKRGYPQSWNYLLASTNGAEASGLPYDFLSNGVKFMGTTQNVSGGTYMYMAFGQSLVGSNNVPCTAR